MLNISSIETLANTFQCATQHTSHSLINELTKYLPIFFSARQSTQIVESSSLARNLLTLRAKHLLPYKKQKGIYH